ncbi:MAG: glycosyltransferase [Lachnospiraceae bacterium]|nr:glycosyltransferase [Lachnospiraceae bacterium]
MVKCSVLMSVYNGEQYLKAAIDSILNQSFTDFQLIIVDDCSKDNTRSILQSYKDERIRLLYNEENLKLAGSLNKAFDVAEGEYIIRIDADDICLPDRLKHQVEFMDHNPNIQLSFSDIVKFKGEELINDHNTNPLQPSYIRTILLFHNVINHNAVIVRRKCLEQIKNKYGYVYDSRFTVSEDMELWTRIVEMYPEGIAGTRNNEVLYRMSEGQVSNAQGGRQLRQNNQILERQLERFFGEESLTEEEKETHYKIAGREAGVSENHLTEWLLRLERRNAATGFYDGKALKCILARMYFMHMFINGYPKSHVWLGIKHFGTGTCCVFCFKTIRNYLIDYYHFNRAKRRIRKENLLSK